MVVAAVPHLEKGPPFGASCRPSPGTPLANQDRESILEVGMFVSRSTIHLTLLAAVIAVTGAACGSSSPSSPTAAASDVTITMVGDRGTQSYSPNPTTMRVGQSVAWRNSDTIVHTSTQDGGRFDTGNVSPGATSSPQTMSTAGTFNYHCTIHPGMVATLVVQ
jgi:plastocyanin